MKKQITFIIFTLISCCSSSAQTKYADSLRRILPTTTKPIDRFHVLNELQLEVVNTVGNNTDSAFSFEMLRIAQDLNNDSLVAITYNWIGTYFFANKGDNVTAIDYYFKGIPLAEKARDNRRISSLYIDIALCYFDLNKNEEGVKYNRIAGQHMPLKSSPMYDYMLTQYQAGMAQYFLNVKQPDSALYYAKATATTNARLGIMGFRISELAFLGAAYAQKGNLKMADSCFIMARVLSSPMQNPTFKYQLYHTYIAFLLGNKRISEAKEQAKELYSLGETNNSNTFRQAGARYLRQVFEAQNQIDSAYHYSRMESDLNGLINSEKNENKLQAVVISEQLRSLEEGREKAEYENKLRIYGLLGGLGVFLIIASLLYRNNRQKQKANTVLESALSNLKSTQSQLIQSEKMASLGELTAGIAHEIQNPINFVNNFSEVNAELISEMKAALQKGNVDEARNIAGTIEDNENKIVSHGKRADAIVKGMLQHSRTSSGQKEPTDINALCDEYLRLSYHGLRAKDKSFNATFKTDFDLSLGKINVIPQELGRVVLNLINNAFYAVTERKKSTPEGYEPAVTVTTKRQNGNVEIQIIDNGNGIPPHIKDKIFQPFFTTKPTGQGTGLGLSLSYDIIKAHRGVLNAETKEGEGTTFIVTLPAD